MFVIYQVTNRINGKSYIGFTTQTFQKRWKQHQSAARRGSKLHLHRAICKYGVSAFEYTLLEEGVDTKFGKNVREIHWIAKLNPVYNSTSGGDGTLGYKASLEQRQTRSLRMKNFKSLNGRYFWHQAPRAPIAGKGSKSYLEGRKSQDL